MMKFNSLLKKIFLKRILNLSHSIAKRTIDSHVYDYSHLVRENVMKYRNISLPLHNWDARPFVRFKSWYRIAPTYKLSGCIVEKSMCTVIQGIFCYLFDPEEFEYANASITSNDWNRRFCQTKNEPPSTRIKDKLMPYQHNTIFMVRDPLQRFLSGFMDKCIHEKSRCFGCEGSVLCVIEQLHKELLRLSSQYPVVDTKRREPFPFTYEAQHMAPQTWYCDLFDESPNTVFLHYGEKGLEHEKMVVDLLEILADHGVEKEKQEYIRKSLLRNTQHSTKNSPVRDSLTEEIKRNPKHLKLFMEMYRYDYEIFGFEPFIKSQ